jgi:hypothetical protein
MTGKSGENQSNNTSSKLVTVLLYDSSFDIDELLNVVKEKNPLVISFDYESHKLLIKYKIKHKISDDYLSEKDIQNIQKNSYYLSQWFENPTISNMLEFEGINLGELSYIEFHYFLVPFLKKFVELTHIFKLYSDAKFVGSSQLYEIISQFTDNAIKSQNNIPKKQFLNDSVVLNFRFFKKKFIINIPTKYYYKIKKIQEKIIDILFKTSHHITNNKSSILLIDFDTIRYQKLFLNFHKTSSNIGLYNRRRPIMWNLKSFSIIKKTKCFIPTVFTLYDNNTKNLTNIHILNIKQKIKSLWTNQSFFNLFFSIDGFSFWSILRPMLVELTEKKIDDTIREIMITKNLFKKYKINSILLWSETAFSDIITIKLAKQHNISTAFIQHGLGDESDKRYESIKFAKIFPVYCDKFIVWGKTSQRYAVRRGFSSEKIEIIGSPIHEVFFDVKLNSNLTNDYILLATSSPIDNNVDGLLVRTRENYELAIEKICKTVVKMNKKLVIKLHPSQVELDITELAKKIDPNIIVVKNHDIVSLIKSCEAFVAIDHSTTILEAQILEKPVISVSVKSDLSDDSEIYKSNSCTRCSIDNFESSLNLILNNTDYRKKQIENGNAFVNESLSNQKNASETLLSFLEKFHINSF